MHDELKKKAGWAALKYVTSGTIIGVGTGSTISYFIDALASMKHEIIGAVSSSETSSARLQAYGIPVMDLNDVNILSLYVDGADEINKQLQMIKGGGAALTREKIIAAVSDCFVCVVDSSKQVDTLGRVPLPVEVIPMARAYVARQLIRLGGRPEYRQNVVTDNGNIILDVYHLNMSHPIQLEKSINALTGVVTVGLFAHRGADVALIGRAQGVQVITKTTQNSDNIIFYSDA
ncbi:ribose-5-phosphate isomerase RpiA [Candidatus Erwinia haradaeae]|uniref:Ribose-5-phosphate isomerase A n=1 Tax=Candidatus Erwinia haradaeae TaxID=1922217 RepID=A0A451D911_9GAMM|nr:ribose-5-phosphate isomerase RpiA [Candidatus Erwinia haradaeae]VFP82767.1 Ribose-5-phosphate isomerase A [Candidatus Erwinia haradaeae]